MPRIFRGALRNVLSAGGQKAVSRFLAQGAGPVEVDEFVQERFPDLLEGDRLTLIDHVQSMQVAGDLLQEGQLLGEDAETDVPMNVRMLADEGGASGERFQTEVIIDYISVDGTMSGSQIYTFHHDDLMSADELEAAAADAFVDDMDQYDDFLGGGGFTAAVTNILSIERAY